MGYVENSWDAPRWLCFAKSMTPSRMALLENKSSQPRGSARKPMQGKSRERFYGYNATTLNRRLWQSSTMGEFHQRNGRVRQRAADFG